MLLDFRCEDCAETFERVVARGDASPRTCKCGGKAHRVYSPFAFKQWKVDRSDWSLVAPLNEEGKPMTMKEAAKYVDPYVAGEEQRERSRLRGEEEKRQADALASAKREAWAEVSAKRRVRING